MGRKLNPEYREKMAERRQLPVCEHCGRRNKRGNHAACERLAAQENVPSRDDLIQEKYKRIDRQFAKFDPPPF